MKHDPDFEKLVEGVLPKIKEVSADEVHEQLQKMPFTLIDVREKEEWDQDRIPQAIHISKGVIERDIAKTVKNKSEPLVLYCGGGYRSALAADNLQKMGYTNVKSVAGGIRSWREKGFKLEK